MAEKTTSSRYEIGMVGLGVMGRNLLLNMADHGFAVAGYDKDPAKVGALNRAGAGNAVQGAATLADFAGALRRPRAVMMLVPAGAPVDAVIRDLEPHLEEGDVLIDGGNSYFKDTALRARRLASRGIHFLGVGVSGGEEGARHGPSLMPGGPPFAYERVRAVLEAAAAKVDGDPCVAWLGPGAAGHFVKMVHNGIEYGIMELLAEAYDLMKRGLHLDDDALHDVYAGWNRGALNSYLVEITGQIFRRVDEQTGRRLIDEILDVARQKGTGMWTSQSAMELHVPVPTIDVAVAMRNLSMLEDERGRAGAVLRAPERRLTAERDDFLGDLGGALEAAMLITYAQGMAVLAAASVSHQFNLDLEAVARIWRGGCIIRAGVLEDLRAAYRRRRELPNPLLDPALADRVTHREPALRRVVGEAAAAGVPVPGFMSALGYLDAYRSAWLPANLIQAQRDYFGAHTYERIDAKGTFHTEWERA